MFRIKEPYLGQYMWTIVHEDRPTEAAAYAPTEEAADVVVESMNAVRLSDLRRCIIWTKKQEKFAGFDNVLHCLETDSKDSFFALNWREDCSGGKGQLIRHVHTKVRRKNEH